jgi:hypothetical protein
VKRAKDSTMFQSYSCCHNCIRILAMPHKNGPVSGNGDEAEAPETGNMLGIRHKSLLGHLLGER